MPVELKRTPGVLSPGFTLVEILVVVTVIAMVIALLLPAVNMTREAARRSVCGNHLRQIGIAQQNYLESYRSFPIGCIECTFLPGRNNHRNKMISWNVALLPYLEQLSTWKIFDYNYAAKSAQNRVATATVIPAFLCPTTSRIAYTSGDINRNGEWDAGDEMGYTDYGGIYGVEGIGRSAPVGLQHFLIADSLGVMLYEIPTEPDAIRDGLSFTALVGESTGRGYQQQSEWSNGHNCFAQNQDIGINVTTDNELHSEHSGVAGVVFCDGHVRYLDQSVEQTVLISILTRSGGESISFQ